MNFSKNDSVPPEKARRFVHSVAKSKGENHPSIGMGETIAFESRSVSGAALVEGNHVYHLSAFKKDTGSGFESHNIRYQRFSHRRRSR